MPRFPTNAACSAALLCAALSTTAEAREPAIPIPVQYQCLAAAYPTYIKGIHPDPAHSRLVVDLESGATLLWDDGRKKTPDQRLDDPDLEDLFATPYPAFAPTFAPGPDEDPGRARPRAFFEGLYGKTERETSAALESVPWFKGRNLQFNKRHGAAAALRRVAVELTKLPEPLHKYFETTSGTYNRREIAGTNRPSAHSWGIAIDLNTDFSDYWRWNAKPGGGLPWKNRIPVEIVRVFERGGFIWGGRWQHYDTMHFEYRPELLDPRCAPHGAERKEASR